MWGGLLVLLGAGWKGELGAGWTWEAEPVELVEGQTARARGLLGGLVVRPLELEVEDRKLGELDLDAALSPDRVARLTQQAQEEELTTLFTGPADGVDARVGRWVYVDSRGVAWWQVFFREGEGFVQLIAWAPADRFSEFATVMRSVEGRVPASGETLLFDGGRADCAVRQVDRASLIRDSRRFEEARGALRSSWEASELDPNALAMAELRILGLLYRKTERCVHAAARSQRACLVHEGPVWGERDRALHAAAVACLDEDGEVPEAISLAIGDFL
ncbi:MAG TPA: hypothetical protein QGF58_01760 [Myxococcota bacterium]|nr:hypothetical protein [Myxococcota bacterium]